MHLSELPLEDRENAFFELPTFAWARHMGLGFGEQIFTQNFFTQKLT